MFSSFDIVSIASQDSKRFQTFGALRGGNGQIFGASRGGSGGINTNPPKFECESSEGRTCPIENSGVLIYSAKMAGHSAAVSLSVLPLAVFFGLRNLNDNFVDKANQLVVQVGGLNNGLNDKANQLVVQATGLNDKANQLVVQANQLVVHANQLVLTFQVSFGVLFLVLGYLILFKRL